LTSLGEHHYLHSIYNSTFSREKAAADSSYEDSLPWSPINPAKTTSAYYQVTGGDADWSGFEMAAAVSGGGKCDPLPDRKYSVPVYNALEAAVKLRDRKDNVPSRPSSLIESSEQKDLKIFEIGNLGDNSRLNNMLNSNSTSQVKNHSSASVVINAFTPKQTLEKVLSSCTFNLPICSAVMDIFLQPPVFFIK
jgi:hypothetical protein